MKIIISLAIVYAGFGISFVLNGYLSRHLDLDGYGDIQVALGIASIGGVLLILGGQAASRRFIPRYLSSERYGEIKGFVSHYLRIALFIGAGATVLALLVAGLFNYLGLEHLTHEALIAVCITPLIAISLFFGSVIQSMQRTAAAILPHEVIRPSLFLLGCVVWLYLFGTFNEIQVIGILFVVLCAVIVIQFYLMVTGLPFKWFEASAASEREAWHTVSIPLLYSILANSILIRIDVLALEVMHADEKAVGVFTLLLFIASLVWMNFNAISNVISPKIAGLDGEKAGLQTLFDGTIKTALLINLAVAGLIVVFADEILGWFHGDLLNYKTWLYVVLIGAVINCALEVAAPFVRIGGLQREAARLASICLIGTIVVTPTAIAFFGMPGAIASLIGMRFVRGMGYMYFLYTRIGIAPFRAVR